MGGRAASCGLAQLRSRDGDRRVVPPVAPTERAGSGVGDSPNQPLQQTAILVRFQWFAVPDLLTRWPTARIARAFSRYFANASTRPSISVTTMLSPPVIAS